jgi:hypothetical protein
VYDPTYGCTTAGADDFGYYDYPGGTVLYGRHGLLWGFAPQFKLIPKWDWGGICGAASSQAAPRYWQKFWPGS